MVNQVGHAQVRVQQHQQQRFFGAHDAGATAGSRGSTKCVC